MMYMRFPQTSSISITVNTNYLVSFDRIEDWISFVVSSIHGNPFKCQSFKLDDETEQGDLAIPRTIINSAIEETPRTSDIQQIHPFLSRSIENDAELVCVSTDKQEHWVLILEG